MKTSLKFPWILGSLFLVSINGLMGCSHKQVKPEDTTDRTPSVATQDLASSDRGNAYGLQSVHFSFDSQLLDEASKSLLNSDADILKKNPILHVQIEGHCDRRGGIQYNLALGEKRAQAVEHYLEDRGVHAERLATISYGKEKPLDPSDTEEAYAKNRRANFVVTQGLN
jgi:peptidoglycan-associated lipoprotein